MTESKQAATFRWLCEKRLTRNWGIPGCADYVVMRPNSQIDVRPDESIEDAVIRAMEADSERNGDATSEEKAG